MRPRSGRAGGSKRSTADDTAQMPPITASARSPGGRTSTIVLSVNTL